MMKNNYFELDEMHLKCLDLDSKGKIIISVLSYCAYILSTSNVKQLENPY